MTIPSSELYREIPLTQGQVAIVDADLFEWLNQWKWHACWDGITKSYYARRAVRIGEGKGRSVRMHRQILGLEFGDKRQVDHREPGQTLLNVRSNLRMATSAQNHYNERMRITNKSGFKGVYWDKAVNRWRSAIRVAGRRVYLGVFHTPEDAAAAYRTAAIPVHGEFARFE